MAESLGLPTDGIRIPPEGSGLPNTDCWGDYLEKKMVHDVEQGRQEREAMNASPRRCRISKTSFSYLLLDPRCWNTSIQHLLGDREAFDCFMDSIFYVGQGKGTRPMDHLSEAVQNEDKDAKTKRINTIWKSGNGVVILRVFIDMSSMESRTRESVMYEALAGRPGLTNIIKPPCHWSDVSDGDKRDLGHYLLYKAYCKDLLGQGRLVTKDEVTRELHQPPTTPQTAHTTPTHQPPTTPQAAQTTQTYQTPTTPQTTPTHQPPTTPQAAQTTQTYQPPTTPQTTPTREPPTTPQAAQTTPTNQPSSPTGIITLEDYQIDAVMTDQWFNDI